MSILQARPTAREALEALETDKVANIVANVARSLLGLIDDRGLPPERLCRGLGFTYQDLQDREVLLSYHQTRSLILRAQSTLAEPALGLAAGARQTPVSWGLAGLAMLTCETFGEAISYGLGHQNEAGAMMHHLFEVHGRVMHIELTPRIYDLEIEPYLIEEAFASALSVSRYLVGTDLSPLRVEFAYSRPADVEPYTRFFRCPVHFNAGVNRLTLESRWMAMRLPGYDRITCGLLRRQLNSLLLQPLGRHELVESIATRLRVSTEEPPRQSDLARQVNLSERTLRRRLQAQSVGFRALRNDARFERAKDMLLNSQEPIADIAQAVGYADVRTFRRAFKRWSGQTPQAFRQSR